MGWKHKKWTKKTRARWTWRNQFFIDLSALVWYNNEDFRVFWVELFVWSVSLLRFTYFKREKRSSTTSIRRNQVSMLSISSLAFFFATNWLTNFINNQLDVGEQNEMNRSTWIDSESLKIEKFMGEQAIYIIMPYLSTKSLTNFLQLWIDYRMTK